MARRVLFGVAVALAVVTGGCGIPLEQFVEEAGPTSGTPCLRDAECVPSNCCGDSSTVRHVSDPPDCRGVRCSKPPTLLNGCGIAICRNDRCTIARDPFCR